MFFLELAESFGWGCFARVFDFYAHNLTQKTKVGNNDQKANNYWYWFMSVATGRDLTAYFNDQHPGWAYDVTNRFHGTEFIEPLHMPTWNSGEPATKCPAVPKQQCGQT